MSTSVGSSHRARRALFNSFQDSPPPQANSTEAVLSQQLISQDVVDTMVRILTEGGSFSSPEKLFNWGEVHLGVPTEDLQGEVFSDVSSAKKALAIKYLTETFGLQKDLETHRKDLVNARKAIVNHFQDKGSGCIVSVFGSHSNGKVNSLLSDIDFLVIVPEDPKEADIIRELTAAGVVFGTASQLDDLTVVAASGDKLCRLYGMTISGVPVEFHVVGERAFKGLPNNSSRGTERVTPVGEKTELRVAYDGHRQKLPKPGNFVPNFSAEKDGRVYRGFFVNGVISSQILYDGFEAQGRGDAGFNLFARIWEKDLGALLYHQGKLMRLPNNRWCVVSDKPVDFYNTVLPTLFHHLSSDYQPTSLGLLTKRFSHTMEAIDRKLNPVYSYSALVDGLQGQDIDVATRELHRIRHEGGATLIATDFDHTIYDPEDTESLKKAADLVARISASGSALAIITGREATFFNSQFAGLQAALKERDVLDPGPVFISTSNGAQIFKVNSQAPNGLELVASVLLDTQTTREIADAYSSISTGFDIDAERMTRDLHEKDWSEHIPADLVDVAKEYTGVFIETGKVVVMMPKNSAYHAEFIERLSDSIKEIDPDLVVSHSNGSPVADVGYSLERGVDPKLAALRRIQQELGVPMDKTVTFGDSPFGNDKGLLSIQNAFTNTPVTTNGPIYLEGPDSVSPVSRVHRAIRYLISGASAGSL